MDNLLLHQVVVLPVLLAINLALVLFLKSTLRYLVPIAVWAALLASFFVPAKWNIREENRIGNAYWASAKNRSYGDQGLWQEMETRNLQSQQTQLNLFRLLGVQTLLVLILQMTGYFKTGRRTLFWWTRTLFIALAIGWLVLAALWAVVPTGPLL
jgi:hypothetical protein